ncbi:hypothetical protein ABPG74_019681 [Tetrahymena malaccensis]
MKSNIINQVQNSCTVFGRSDMILILDAFEKKNPDYIQTMRVVKERKISTRKYKTPDLLCLQLEVFDKETQSKKIIEVFSSDKLKQAFELVIQIAQQCKNIIRTDFILKVIDSYYLDEFMIFYVVEYEFFDFDSQDIDQDFLQMELANLEYEKSFSKLLSEINQRDIRNLYDCYYVFQQKANGLQIKLNIIDPYLFNDYIAPQQQNKKSFTLQKLTLLQPKQNLQIAKEDFSLFLQTNYSDLYKEYKDFLDYLTNKESQFISFILLIFDQNQNYLTLEGITQDLQQTYFTIKKCSTIQEGKKYYKEYQKQLEILNEVCIKHYTQDEPTISSYFILQTQLQKLKCHMKIKEFNYNIPTNKNLKNYLAFIERFISYKKAFIKLNISLDYLYVSEDLDLIIDQRVFEQTQQKQITQFASEYVLFFEWLFRIFYVYFDSNFDYRQICSIVNNYYENMDDNSNNNYLVIQEAINSIKRIISINEKFDEKFEPHNLIRFFQQEFNYYRLILNYENFMSCLHLKIFISIFRENNNFKDIQFYASIFLDLLEEESSDFTEQLDQWLSTEKELNDKEKEKVEQLALKYQQLRLQQDKTQNSNLTNEDLCLCQQYFDQEEEEEQRLLLIHSIIHVKLDQLLGYQSTKVCYCYNYFRILNTIKSNQKNLQDLSFSLKMCQYVEQQLQNNQDFFNFKDNQNLFTIRLLLFPECTLNQLNQVYQQIASNMYKINTIYVDYSNILLKNIFIKLPRLVVISISNI